MNPSTSDMSDDELMNIYYSIFHPNLGEEVFVYFSTLTQYFEMENIEYQKKSLEAIWQLINSEYGIFRKLNALIEYNQIDDDEKLKVINQLEQRRENLNLTVKWMNNEIARIREKHRDLFNNNYELYFGQLSLHPELQESLKQLHKKLNNP